MTLINAIKEKIVREAARLTWCVSVLPRVMRRSPKRTESIAETRDGHLLPRSVIRPYASSRSKRVFCDCNGILSKKKSFAQFLRSEKSWEMLLKFLMFVLGISTLALVLFTAIAIITYFIKK